MCWVCRGYQRGQRRSSLVFSHALGGRYLQGPSRAQTVDQRRRPCRRAPEHSHRVVAENDVVLRVAFPEFFHHLVVKVVVGVFRLPAAQRHAQFVQQRAIDRNVGFGGRFERVFGQKNQALLLAPGFEQVFESFARNGFAGAFTDALDDVELLEVVVDQQLADE